MNWDQVQGKWKQIKGSAKTRWGKLTHDDLHVIAGQRDELVGRIQERYGIAKDEALRQAEEWNRTLDSGTTKAERDRETQRKAS